MLSCYFWGFAEKYTKYGHIPAEAALPEKLGGGVRSILQNTYPIYYQNVRFLLPYLWPDQKCDTLFISIATGTVALNISYEGLLLTVLLIMMEK